LDIRGLLAAGLRAVFFVVFFAVFFALLVLLVHGGPGPAPARCGRLGQPPATPSLSFRP